MRLLVRATAYAACLKGPITKVANATFSCGASTRTGARCVAACAPGFVGMPAPTAKCSELGLWTIPQGTCRRSERRAAASCLS